MSEHDEQEQESTARVWPPPPLPHGGTTQPLEVETGSPGGGDPAPAAAPVPAPALAPEAPPEAPPLRARACHGIRMPTVVLGLLLCLVAGSVQAARFGHQQLDLGTLVVATLLVSGVLLVAGAIFGAPGRHRR